MIRARNAVGLKPYIGQTIVCPRPVCVSIEILREFLQISGDVQLIHNPKRRHAAVVPANLVLSLIPQSLQSGIRVDEFTECMTVSYKKIRFFHVIHPESTLLLSATLTSVRQLDGAYFVDTTMQLRKEEAGELVVSLIQTDRYL